jgi:polyhydroxybutyrate depolymerase
VAKRFMFAAAFAALLAGGLASASAAQDRLERLRQLRQQMLAAQSQPSDPQETRITAPGDYRFHFTHGGIRRDYLVHVPASEPRGGKAPIVLALHGGGGGMNYQANNYDLKLKADEAGFIAVFPNGYSRFRGGVLATWNAGKCCGQARDSSIDDVGFLKLVIARVVRHTNADPSRVFVTGMSNGGMMAYRLACEAPGLIRGIAPVAGTDNTNVCTPSRPTPVIHFHARDDTHVLYTGGAGKDAFRNRSVVTDFTSVPTTIAKWVAINRADPKATALLAVPGARCDIHAARAGGAPVQLCTTDGGGHSWPGVPGNRPGKTPSQAISANDLMWDFFSAL